MIGVPHACGSSRRDVGAHTLLVRTGAFLAALFLVWSVRADWTTVEERWFALSLAGEPCGRSMERVEQDGVGDAARFRTTSRIEMRFVRLGQETRVDLAVAFVETAGGEPVEAALLQDDVVAVRYRFESAQGQAASSPMKVSVERGATHEVRELASSQWLTPREVSHYLREHVPTREPVLAYRTLDLQSGLVLAEVRMKREELPTGAAALGGNLDTKHDTNDRANHSGSQSGIHSGSQSGIHGFATTTSVSGVTARETYNAQGVLIESKAAIGLGDLVSKSVTRDEANRSYDQASFDLLASTFVPMAKIIGWGARASLALELRAKGESLPELPTVGAQRFTRVDARNGKVDIDVVRGSPADEGDASAPRYLDASDTIDFDDPVVRTLFNSAKLPAKDERTPNLFARAERLRVLVFQHLQDKNLGTAFASASEAARARGGDCTEHAVLLAALLRADSIPSRVVSGLVYVPEFQGRGAGFAWHLWTQALVEPPIVAGGGGRAWVDFDATLPPNERFHPGHVAVGTTDLAGGASDPVFSQALSLVGGVEIREAPR